MGLRGGGGHAKKIGVKGGPVKKILFVRGVTQKITLKCCNDSINDGAKISTIMPKNCISEVLKI